MFTRLAIVLALSAVAFGNVFITAPVSTTTWAAGTPQTVSWQDDGTTPTLQSFGPAKISIYVGGAQQQTLLQAITPSLDVSTAGSIQFTPDPTIGPNSDQYFIRFESLSLKDPTTPTAPALAFSAKFSMTGMTGTFSPAIQAQISSLSLASTAAPSSSPIVKVGPSTTQTAGANNTPAAAKPAAASSAKPASSSPSGTGASAAKASGAATSLSHSGFVAVAAAAAAVGVALY